MLIIKDLTIKDLKNHIFIEHFYYSLGNQDKVGIIGEEGNGKSTFLKAIMNSKEIQNYMVMNGEIIKDFQHIGYLAQKLPFKWEQVPVCDFLLKREATEELPFERYNDLQDYEEICQQMHIPYELLQRDQMMMTCSGGEKVKLQMLKLMKQPLDLLLLDEPTNDLDIQTLEWMETFLNECKIPVMFISHDTKLLQHCANVILHFEQLNHQSTCKTTVFKGTYQAYVTQRRERRNKEIQLARKEKQEYMKKKIQLNNQRNAVHDALNDTVRNPKAAASLKRKMTKIKALERRYEKQSPMSIDSIEDAIQVQFDSIEAHEQKVILDLSLKELIVDGRSLLNDVRLHVKGKEKVILTGENGSGKSMLMKHIYTQLKDRSDITLGYMPQNYADYMDFKMTPISFLLEEGDSFDVTRSRELLGAMKFTTEEMNHSIQEISEGQKAKLYLLKFIKQRCNVLLLDEPTRNLSPLSSPAIIRLIRDFEGCLMVVSHDRSLLEQLCARRVKLVKHHLEEY